MAAYCQVYGVIHFTSHAVTSMEKLYLFCRPTSRPFNPALNAFLVAPQIRILLISVRTTQLQQLS